MFQCLENILHGFSRHWKTSHPMGIKIDKNFGGRECPSCATEVSANHNRCPICGYEFPVMPRARKATVWLVAFVLLVILAGAWILRAW